MTNEATSRSMSDRERGVLQLVAKGLSNKDIARELGIADATVKVHVKTLLRLLGLHNRTQLALRYHGHL